jgi:hypothetical protein
MRKVKKIRILPDSKTLSIVIRKVWFNTPPQICAQICALALFAANLRLCGEDVHCLETSSFPFVKSAVIFVLQHRG